METAWTSSQYNDGLSRYRIPIIKMRLSWYRPIFIKGIHILIRRYLYTEMAPGVSLWIYRLTNIQKPNHYLFDGREGVCRFQRWTKSLTFMWDTFTHPYPHRYTYQYVCTFWKTNLPKEGNYVCNTIRGIRRPNHFKSIVVEWNSLHPWSKWW